MIRVLVTGAGALLGQGILKALRRSALDLELVAADPNPLSAGLYWANRGYVIPLVDQVDFLERFSQLLKLERPDVVLIGTDVELPVLASHRETLERDFGTRILVSPRRVVDIANDKYETFRFLAEKGLNPPLSALADDATSLRRLVDRVGYPLVVKPRVGARSVGVGVVDSDQALAAAIAGRRDLVVQEMAGSSDEEFTSSALVFDGIAEASIVMRRDLRDGNTYRAYVQPYPELNRFVRRAAEALGAVGPINLQFRTDASGNPRIFEINARFSGATPLRAIVGFNEVELCLRRLLFQEPIRTGPIMPGTILRHLSETFVSEADISRLR